MIERITIGKQTAEMIADFLLGHGHEWGRFYDARKRKARVFDIRYSPSEEAIQTWRTLIALLTEDISDTQQNTNVAP